jgi:hypothetical protein
MITPGLRIALAIWPGGAAHGQALVVRVFRCRAAVEFAKLVLKHKIIGIQDRERDNDADRDADDNGRGRRRAAAEQGCGHRHAPLSGRRDERGEVFAFVG